MSTSWAAIYDEEYSETEEIPVAKGIRHELAKTDPVPCQQVSLEDIFSSLGALAAIISYLGDEYRKGYEDMHHQIQGQRSRKRTTGLDPRGLVKL